ncbi:MAG: YggS family pyridoxal phosphate-dependent enzyme [Bacteroidia bacterium]
MASVAENINQTKTQLPKGVTLVVVSKTQPNALIEAAYLSGQRVFGENRVQELVPKYEALPNDIAWHLIGHLQSNKVKYIAPFVALIHSVDSEKLLAEIDKQAARCNRKIEVLLQMYIAQEETKFGFDVEETALLLEKRSEFPNVNIVGLMGMATNTDDMIQVRKEFRGLGEFFKLMQEKYGQENFHTLSMGMSSDWQIAVEEGSTMIRIGSSIFKQV